MIKKKIINYNKELASLWDEIYNDKSKRNSFGTLLIPTPFPTLKRKKFLCVGLNPSFDTSWWYNSIKADNKFQSHIPDINKERIIKLLSKKITDQKQLKQEIKKAIDTKKEKIISNFFKFNGKEAFLNNLSLYKSLERLGLKGHGYFKKFEKLAKILYKSKSKYIHIDLFSFKICSSKELIKYIQNDPTFFEDQLKIFKKVLNVIQPEIILVANADASKIFKLMYFDDKSEDFLKDFHKHFKHEKYMRKKGNLYNKEFSYYNINSDCKVFFSGMLTQQRALDLDSFDRLCHVMKKYMNKLKDINRKNIA